MEYKVSCMGREKSYEEGTSWERIAEDFSDLYSDDVLLVLDTENNTVLELGKGIECDRSVRFLTYKDKEGRTSYARSAIFMMLKAFYNILGRDRIEKIEVQFTIGGNFFILPRGRFIPDEELISKVRDRMKEYVNGDMAFEKVNIRSDEAVERFHRFGMYDKERLFRFRRSSRVNIYRLEKFEDYFYGPMCPSTGYIKCFDLRIFHDGVVLMLPKDEDPHELREFNPSEKLFKVQYESFKWADEIGIDNIASLNRVICEGRANDLILTQEAFFEKKIGEISQRISVGDKRIILLAGPSSSGKTSTAHRLAIQLRAYGVRPHAISADNYFKDLATRPLGKDGKPDFESLNAVDTELFNRDMQRLLAGETVELPRYNFKTGMREYKGDTLRLSEKDVLIIEGIHCLNDDFSSGLPASEKFRIYVSALTQLNIDEHNRIPTTDLRLIRRMVRDNAKRGYSARDTIRNWPDVRAGEEDNIFPYQENADVIFNTSMIYETAVLKLFAEPLLFSVPRDCEEYLEAKRLLKFFDYVLPLSPEMIPRTSIIREFIGGSCLDVG